MSGLVRATRLRPVALATVFGASFGCGGTSEVDAADASVDGAAGQVRHYLDARPEHSDDAAQDSAVGAAGIDASCAPLDAGAPPPFVPPRAPRSACTDAQIHAYYSNCFAGTSTSCDAFKGDPDNSPCVLCIRSSSSDLAWGPIVEFSNDSSQANIGGCIAMLDQDASAGSCAANQQAYDLCRHDSCASTCPNGLTTAGLQAFDDCEAQAQTTTCAAYALAAQCHQAVRYTPCLFANFQSYFIGLGRIFCEPGFDAGTAADASADAPNE